MLPVDLNPEHQPLPLDLAFTEPGRFQVRASGAVTFEQVEAFLVDLVKHPGAKPGMEFLVDASLVEAVPSTPELRRIARMLKPLVERGMTGIAIVTENPFVYGVARMFSVFAEAVGANVGTFREAAEARRWLAELRARAAVADKRPTP
jgi:hypothetical protein